MRALLLINEISGDSVPNTAKVDGIRAVLEPAGFDIRVETLGENDDAGRLSRQAVESGIDAILVGGGDGTVGMVAKELVGKPTALGVIPLGTFNNIARSIGMPAEPEDACALIAKKSISSIDVGRLKDGGYFFEAAGCGIDAQLFPLGEDIKCGHWTRIVRFARLTMRYNARRMHLRFDRPVGEALASGGGRRFSRRMREESSVTLRALLVAVGNGPYYGGGFGVVPGARLTDGLLTVAAYRHFSKLELFRHFWSISRGKRRYSPKIETFHAAEISVSANGPLDIHLDGVPCGNAPATFVAVPKALNVFANLP